MVKRQSKNSKLKQKGGNPNAQPLNSQMGPNKPQSPPMDAMGPGEWIWQAYNPTGFGSAMGRFAESNDRAIKKASGGRKLQWFWFIYIYNILFGCNRKGYF